MTMKKALIVSQAENTAAEEKLLRAEGFTKITVVSSGNEARRIIANDPDKELIVVSSPLSDEYGCELCITAAEYSPVILICSGDMLSDAEERLSESGVCVLSRPVGRAEFGNAVRAAVSSQNSMAGHEPESAEILTKIEEMRVISRAKCTLMQYLGFTESQAHRYIEKQAMNSRTTRLAVAAKLLRDYER